MNTRIRSIKIWLLVASALFFSGCTALKPIDMVEEYTPTPSQAPLWVALEEIRSDNWFVLLNGPKDALDWRIRAIDSAVESIDLQTFLWDFDTVGSLTLRRLMAAADRGVMVRVLVDDTFLIAKDRALVAIADHPMIEYRVFNPYKHRAGGFVSREIVNLTEFSRLDHRMHNKAMIIDNRVAIVGGRNLANEYFGLDSKANFRDLELLTGGPIIGDVTASFDNYFNDDWSFPIDKVTHIQPDVVDVTSVIHQHNSEIYEYEDIPQIEIHQHWVNAVKTASAGEAFLYVDKPPATNPASGSYTPVQLAMELVELIDSAKEEIIVLSAYLIPSPELEHAVKQAVMRGVDVRILTNSIRSNNHLAAHSAYRKHIRNLLKYGAELHEVRFDAHDRGLYMFPPLDQKTLALHAKVMVIDSDRVFVGSANLDPRSLRLNTEMGLLVYSNSLNAELRLMVEADFDLTNSWHLQFDQSGEVTWVSEKVVRKSQPAASFMQKLEDWFFMHLPIENEM